MPKPSDLLQGTLDLLILKTHRPRAAAWLGGRQAHSVRSPARSSPSARARSTRRCTGSSSRAGSGRMEGLRSRPQREVLLADAGRQETTRTGAEKLEPALVGGAPADSERVRAHALLRLLRAASPLAVPPPGRGGRTGARAEPSPRTAHARAHGGGHERSRTRGARRGARSDRPTSRTSNAATPGASDCWKISSKDARLRAAAAGALARLRADGGAVARARHRRQHRDLQPGRHRAAALAAGGASAGAGVLADRRHRGTRRRAAVSLLRAHPQRDVGVRRHGRVRDRRAATWRWTARSSRCSARWHREATSMSSD